MPLHAIGKQHRPLTSLSHAARQPQHPSLRPDLPSASAVANPSLDGESLRLGLLFSGPHSRADGLPPHLKSRGWSHIELLGNNELGDGWAHDLLNDSTYAEYLLKATSGHFDAILTAFPCAAPSATLRTKDFPDGLQHLDQIDPKLHEELRLSNLLLERVVNILIAARSSPKRTTGRGERAAVRSLLDPCLGAACAGNGGGGGEIAGAVLGSTGNGLDVTDAGVVPPVHELPGLSRG